MSASEIPVDRWHVRIASDAMKTLSQLGNKMLRFDGKSAVVTGAGSGIGKAIAAALARQGAQVAILERDPEVGQAAADEISQTYDGRATFYRCDVTSQTEIRDVAAAIVSQQGTIDCLVNNAGIAHVGDAATTSEADFDRVMNVNCKGVYNCAHEILPIMVRGGGGVICNIASTVAWFGIGERFAYSASKGAVVAMTYSIARDFVADGIRCNAILPGRIHTPFVDGFVKKNYPGQEEEMFQKLADFQPVGRMGQPEEIANAAVFLCSDEASFVTGSIHAIDGGTISIR